MRAVISTNGVLINEDKAAELKDLGLSYVGISLDGLAEVNDRFRGVPGAFDMAVAGIKELPGRRFEGRALRLSP